MKAVLYARVSSREQKEGYSLEAQVKLGRDYSSRHGLDVVKECVVAESAKNNAREAFREMLSFLQKNKDVKIIICEKVDRLLRGDLSDRVSLDDLMTQFGKEIHFVKEGMILNSESKSAQKLQFDIQVALARHYLNNLSDEVRKSYDVMVEDGRYPHPPPIGYKRRLENHNAVADPDTMHFIVRAFELAVKGTYSEKVISEILYKEGFRSRSGIQVGKSDIGGILHNPFYYGDFLWKGELKKGIHQPLISKALFDRVHEVMSPRGKSKGKKHNFTYAGGLLKCGYCGNGITAEIQKGHIYYRCTKPKGARSCIQKYIREEIIEEQLMEIIKSIEIDSQTIDLIKKVLLESHTEEEEYHKKSLEALQSRYEIIKNKLDRLLDTYIDGGISKDIYISKSQQLENERIDINDQIAKHKHSDEIYFSQIESFLEISRQAPDLFKSSSPTLKREFLKYVVSNLVLRDKTVTASFNLPFSLLVEYHDSGNWQG